MTVEQAKQAVLDLARSEVGYHEKASNYNLNDPTANSGGANWTKYAEYLDSFAGFYNGPKNGWPWCDVFYDYLFVKTFGMDKGRQMLCQPLNSAGAGCLYSTQYYKQAGRWFVTPEPGDQIFFSYTSGEVSHTGIVEKVDGSTVTTIEGNSSDSVSRRTYRIGDSSIVGYGRPDWKLAEDWVVVEHGQIVNSSAWAKEEEKPVVAQKKEIHEWSPPLLKYAPNDYYEAVKLAQALLNVYGFDSGKADGYYGPKTVAAVNRAKRFYVLEHDGIFDKELWEALGVK